MHTTSIFIRTEPEIKNKIKKIASEIGLSVSALLNRYLNDIIENKSIARKHSEIPSKYLLAAIKKARKERKEGKTSPLFTNAKDAIKWLNS